MTNTGRFLVYFINIIFALIEGLIAIRIILFLLGANFNTPFAAWIYDVTRTLLYPFQAIFPSPVLRGQFVLDMSAIVALLVYALLNYLLKELIKFVNYNSTNYFVNKN